MRSKVNYRTFLLAVCCLTMINSAVVADSTSSCVGYGPQAPRDIDNLAGENKTTFAKAPAYNEMNLCNIHFHKNAEHKAKDFSLLGSEGEEGGNQCAMSRELSSDELKASEMDGCHGIEPGDTVEVHWVFTSCDVKPGKGLGACLSEACSNPNLRVESQVFTLVHDHSAMDFASLTESKEPINNYYQPKSLPTNTGKPVEFLGSTTGPSFTSEKCSPFQVTWGVRPNCAKLDIDSISQWCGNNVYSESHAHKVRKLVKNPLLLSPLS